MIMMQGNVLLEFSDYFVEIRIQHRNLYLDLSFRRLFGDRDLDREKEKRMNSQKNLYSCYEEVYSKFLIHYSLSSSSYHKSISKSVWYDLPVDRLQRRCLSGDQERLPRENVHHIQSITPCENRSDTTSTKITTKQLPRESKVKRCHNRHLTENLSNCEVVVQLETLPARRFRRETFCVSCSFTLYIVDFT